MCVYDSKKKMFFKNSYTYAGKLVLLKISSSICLTSQLQYVAKGVCVTFLLQSSDVDEFQINKCFILSSAPQCLVNQLVLSSTPIINFLVGEIFLLLKMWGCLCNSLGI